MRVCVSTCMAVRHSGLVSMFVLDSCVIFLYVWTRGLLKKTHVHCHTRTARQQVGGNHLVCAAMLSSPVSCQNRKGQGRKWRLGKRCLDVCWREIQLCLTVTLLARKNRPVQGVTRSGILHGVIFITFTKHSEGCFSQLLTQVWVIFVFKTV